MTEPPGFPPPPPPLPGPGPEYAYPAFYPLSARGRRTSGLAVASMVLGIVWVYWIGSLLAVVFGHIALAQMKRDPGFTGRGMAVAGLVLGYVGLALLAFGVFLGVAVTMASSGSTV